MYQNLKISIGLPVFNGEKFLRKRIDSILNQTYSNFELIISDNASTDKTRLICEEYTRKDSRIKYFRQKKNMGATWNWNFVLKQAKCRYFFWAMVDDLINAQFLEKNLEFLLTKSNYVASVSKLELFGEETDYVKINSYDGIFKKNWKKIRRHFRKTNISSFTGIYEKKIKDYLKKDKLNVCTFAIFKTNVLRKCLIDKKFVGNDKAMILKVLKYGDINVIDQILMYKYDGGTSTSIINFARKFNDGIFEIVFPSSPFTRWFFKEFGLRLFLKNIDHFIFINLMGTLNVILDLIRRNMK